MNSIVKQGKTVEDAVSLAIKELGVAREDVEITVLEQPKSGFLGIIGAKDALVKVSVKEEMPLINTQEKAIITETIQSQPEVVKEEIEEKEEIIISEKQEIISEETKLDDQESFEKARQFLLDVLNKMDIKADVNMEKDDNFLRFEIICENDNDTGIIIGKRGETLDSIQYLVNLVLNRYTEEYVRVSLDTNGYRKKRIESLENLAHRMVKKARKYNRNMKLEAMNPFERRIIHSALQNEKGIITTSEGEEPFRRVVIKIKKKYQ